jgi:hypothetical protein
MNDPLWKMEPSDPNWWSEFAEEVENLAVAILQSNPSRRDRKIAELHEAFHKLSRNLSSSKEAE